MKSVEEFYDMEPAFVDVKMDVSGLKVWGTGLPDLCTSALNAPEQWTVDSNNVITIIPLFFLHSIANS